MVMKRESSAELNRKKYDIIRMAVSLPVGGQMSGQLCPFCGGGGKKEHTLSITRDVTGVSYYCHRNKCEEKGRAISLSRDGPKKPVTRIRPMSYSYSGLYPAQVDVIIKKYEGIDREDVKTWKWCTNLGRILIPLRDPTGTVWGWDARIITELVDKKGPKSMIYHDSPVEHRLAYFKYKDVTTKGILLVEDAVSAQAAAAYINTAALLGVNLSLKKLAALRQNYEYVAVALDPDACGTGVKMQSRLQLVFKDATVLVLPDDPKDMDSNALFKQLQRDCTGWCMGD